MSILGVSNPVGTGAGLNYIGDHVHGTSGAVADASSGSAATTLFDFGTASNSYILAELDVITNHEGSAAIYLDVELNGELIWQGKADDSPNLYQAMPLTFMIPGDSHVVIKWGSSTSAELTAVITRRVYA